MNNNLRQNERELVKVAGFFKKESARLMAEGKLGPEHEEVGHAVDRFIEHLNAHADLRASIMAQREQLQQLVRDDAVCPECNSSEKLKLVGTEKNEKGWKSNRYRCRRCNIAFTWNRPNNPWDMIPYVEEVMEQLRGRATEDPAESEQFRLAVESMEANLAKLKPVIEAHNQEYIVLIAREDEMEKLVHEFKNSLLIEKIKLDTWDKRTQ